MTADASLEIRKLPPSHISQLSSILDVADQWKILMAVVPKILVKDHFECDINSENPPKYNTDHIRLIEEASHKYKRRGTEILLDEWGCSGRIRPAVGHLLHLLIQAQLFRAADYVATNILEKNLPNRPVHGPAAPVNIQSHLLQEQMSETEFPSSLLENLSNSSFYNNLNHATNNSIPQIIVTPDADQLPAIPDFHVQSTVSSQSEVLNVTETANNPVSDDLNLPNSTVLNVGNVSDNSIQHGEEYNMPNLSILNESSRESVTPNVTTSKQPSNENVIPNLSILNESFASEQSITPNIPILSDRLNSSVENGGIPNLSALNQTSEYIPDLSGLMENDNLPSTSTNSVLIPNISISTFTSKVDVADSRNDEIGNLIPETTRRLSLNTSTNTFHSIKSRQCVSPLPNLTLNTHLSHFPYHEIEKATNFFNEEPFVGLDHAGRFLGSGAFGQVFLAENLLDKPVAVKKLSLENAKVVRVDDKVTKQFRIEVEVLSQFKHRNLLALLGFSCDGCTYCLLYEYISGGTLKDRLQNTENKLTWKERLPIALGTAEAITYLHTAFSTPLIHRDIKTANILLDCSDTPKLGDFGLTKLLDHQKTNSYTVIGTSAYMSPEALRGDVSVKCDTFSFGVVLIELLTSLPHYDEKRDGNDLVTHFEAKCEKSIQPLLDTSIGTWVANNVDFGEGLYEIAKKCLLKQNDRPVMEQVTQMILKLLQKL